MKLNLFLVDYSFFYPLIFLIFSYLIKLSINAIAAFSDKPLNLGIVVGLIMGFLSVVVGIYSIVMYFIDKPVSGYTTLVVLISFMFSINLIVIGIIGKYIAYIFQEIKELVNDLRSESLLILQSLPPYLDFGKLSEKDLIDINAQYRTINHYVIELHDEVDEFENILHFNKENDFVRYVTKYKKDVTNLISYFNIKITGLLTQKIYGLKNKEK